VLGFGNGALGQLGDPTLAAAERPFRFLPTVIAGIPPVRMVACGEMHNQ
jgi:hypothetical protein